MFSINLAFDLVPTGSDVFEAMDKRWEGYELSSLDPERAELYALCEQTGVGISVMKTLGAGKLISPEHTPFSRPMTVNQCVHYALSRPAVFSVLLGCQTGSEVKDALTYLKADEADKDFTPFLSELEGNFTGKCVYCSHCQPLSGRDRYRYGEQVPRYRPVGSAKGPGDHPAALSQSGKGRRCLHSLRQL